MDKIIVKVRESITGQKLITIPRDSELQKGDYVIIKKIEAN